MQKITSSAFHWPNKHLRCQLAKEMLRVQVPLQSTSAPACTTVVRKSIRCACNPTNQHVPVQACAVSYN